MSHVPTPKPKGRHRAAPPSTDPANVVPLDSFFPTEQLPIVGPKKPQTRRERREMEAAEKRAQHRKAAKLATGSLLVVSAAGGAVGLQSVASPMVRKSEISAAPAAIETIQGAVLAGSEPIKFERPNVGTIAAPPPPPPAPVAVAPKPAPIVRVDAVTPAPTPPPPPAPVGTKAAAIAQAALNQVGVYQDCTRLVSNSLLAVGIVFHDWPAGYLSLGRVFYNINEAVPGDLIWYDDGGSASLPGWDHIAVYIGNGKAVHGGFNGNSTVVFSVNVGSGPGAFVRVA